MNDIYELARRRVARKKLFYQHLTLYLAVVIFLFLLNAVLFVRFGWNYDPDQRTTDIIKEILNYRYWWFQYPLLGWGMLLFIHYCTAFGIPMVGYFDEKWEAMAIEEEARRLKLKASQFTPTEKELELKILQKEAQEAEAWKNSELL